MADRNVWSWSAATEPRASSALRSIVLPPLDWHSHVSLSRINNFYQFPFKDFFSYLTSVLKYLEFSKGSVFNDVQGIHLLFVSLNAIGKGLEGDLSVIYQIYRRYICDRTVLYMESHPYWLFPHVFFLRENNQGIRNSLLEVWMLWKGRENAISVLVGLKVKVDSIVCYQRQSWMLGTLPESLSPRAPSTRAKYTFCTLPKKLWSCGQDSRSVGSYPWCIISCTPSRPTKFKNKKQRFL